MRCRCLPALLALAALPLLRAAVSPGGMLFPRESESRDVRTLDGVWNFRLCPEEDPEQGSRERWFHQDLTQTGEVIPMPVPASYNDVTTERYIRDHVGVVYYDRTFFVPANWDAGSSRVWMRFGSVHYAAKVWINGHLVMMHEIGHLPFEKEITSKLRFGAKNRVTVEVDNTLYQQSIPQGRLVEINTDMGPKTVQTYTFDFFNYAGIHRPVYLYTTPHTYLDDMTITTDVDGSTGYINYALVLGGVTSRETPRIQIDVLDADGNFVYSHTDHDGLKGRIEVPDARLWWPYLMDPDPGYLYTLQVRVTGHIWGHDDVYRQPVGIRTVEWTNSSVLINGKPIYIRGFGKHEDGNIRGKGLDYPTLVRDFNLFKWVGGNAFRTSHYPYAEEIMDFADRMGIMVIDECPSVDTENYSPTLLQKHKDSLGELIRRDKNRPSVIMWSVANEARTQLADADAYFKNVVAYVKTLDKTRPVTAAISRQFYEDKVVQHLDVVGVNRYYGWYRDSGRLEVVRTNTENDMANWRHKHPSKPFLMMEYGADTYSGLHQLPEYVWSEEYQISLMSENFKAFDNLRKKGWFIGEMIWNFADFMTAQTSARVGGNKKGIFTRDRQPKSSAHHVRRRYFALAQELDGYTLPEDLAPYVYTPVGNGTNYL